MKKILFASCLPVIIVASLHAQHNETLANAYKKTFTAKFAPASLGIGKITVGGEYNFKHKQSLTLLLGIPFNKSHTVTYDSKSSNVISSSRSAMAGYRYYLGRRDMAGFYIEPYAKYLKFRTDGFLDADLEGTPARFDSHFNYEGYGAGLQAGVQFFIGKTVAIDLFLIGPEANLSKFSSVSTDVYNNIAWTLGDAQEAEKDIKENLKKIPYLGDKIDVTVNTKAKTVYTKFSGFAPGFRAGASVGIRF